MSPAAVHEVCRPTTKPVQWLRRGAKILAGRLLSSAARGADPIAVSALEAKRYERRQDDSASKALASGQPEYVLLLEHECQPGRSRPLTRGGGEGQRATIESARSGA